MNPLVQQVEAKLQELATETDAVRKSAQFQQYLDAMAKFHDYSLHNQLLIFFRMPTASRVAGFKAWQELGRKIKKGSKAIQILAPRIRVEKKDGKEEEVICNFAQRNNDFSGKQMCTEEHISFFPVSVFDISQTEGEELPELDVALQGNDQQKLLKALEEFCEVRNIKLDFKELGVNGLYGYSQGGRVVVSSKDSVNMQVNTLVHEIAHELLHHPSTLSKQQKEIQAESVAYVVCKHFGLETKSFTYLALQEADSKQIMENLEAISLACKEIINFLFSFQKSMVYTHSEKP